MGTIINLYVILRPQNPKRQRAAEVAEMLVAEHLVAPPCVIGPALVPSQIWPVQPQAAIGYPSADFEQGAQRRFELPQAFRGLGTTGKPQIVAFSRLDE